MIAALRSWVWAPILLFAGITVPGLLAPAAADASPADSQVSDRVVRYAIVNEQAMCERLDADPSVAGVEGLVLDVMGDGLTPREAGQAIYLGVDDLCPEHMPVLVDFANKWAPSGRQIA